MRLVHSKTPLPRRWKTLDDKGIILSTDIYITPRARLHAKLLVFDKNISMRKFWRKYISTWDIGSKTLGAVHSLTTQHTKFEKDGTEKNWIEADPRYYCVIALIEGKIDVDVIAHEAVHAAFAYAKRNRRSPWHAESKRFDEEEICYPAGRINYAITKVLVEHNINIKL